MIVFVGMCGILISCNLDSDSTEPTSTSFALQQQNLSPGSAVFNNGVKFCNAIDNKESYINTFDGDGINFNGTKKSCGSNSTSEFSFKRIFDNSLKKYDLDKCATKGDFTSCTTTFRDGYIGTYYGPDFDVIKKYCDLVGNGSTFSNEQVVGGSVYRVFFGEDSNSLVTLEYQKLDTSGAGTSVVEKIFMRVFQNQAGTLIRKNGHIRFLAVETKCSDDSGFNRSTYSWQ